MQETAPAEQSQMPYAAVVLVLAVAILAISSSAVLILWADAPAVSITFWRTLGGAVILGPMAVRSSTRKGHGASDRPTARQWLILIASGVALGLHFATWLSSLELTSVAASVTLVATAPIFIAVASAVLGRPPGRATWMAIGLAIVGTAIITAGDALVGAGGEAGSAAQLATTGSDPVVGDLLALVGAAAMAIYLMLGDRLRSTMSTVAYASRTYAVAAVAVLVFAIATGTELTGFDTRTWLAIGAMVLGPQLAGHTVLNHLLRRLGSVSVSLSLLLEPIGAATLVWLIFEQLPPVTALIGGPVVLVAVGYRIVALGRAPRSSRTGTTVDA